VQRKQDTQSKAAKQQSSKAAKQIRR